MAAVCCSCNVDGVGVPGEPGALRAPVIDGYESPDELGFDLHELRANAVVAPNWLGCTGTVVGDRAVVTAAHCVVLNQDEWIMEGAEPEVVNPMYQTYTVGPDASRPLCELQAESVHVHPETLPQPTLARIDHDVALVILTESVLESCPELLPISMNRETITEEFEGLQLLQGGFGSLDGTYNFSHIRYWSLLELEFFSEQDISLENIRQGFPTYGDSGAGAFYRFPDGIVRNLGVASSGGGALMRFARLDIQADFFDDLVTTADLCGSAAEGLCRDGLLVTCDDAGFATTDCEAEGGECVVDDDDVASCTCPCDEDQYCHADCACDSDCPCDCDETDDCDGCDCDPDCEGSDAGPGDAGADADGPTFMAGGGGCAQAAATAGSTTLRRLFLGL